MFDKIKEWWMNLTDAQRKMVIGAIVTLVLAMVSVVFGIPLLNNLRDSALDVPIELGTTHFTNVSAEDLTATDDLAVTDDATIGGDLTVSGTASWGCSNTTIEDELVVDKARITSTLILTGTADLQGNISSSTGAITIADTINATGAVDFDSTLNVDGAATVDSLDVDNGSITLQNDETIGNATDGLISLGGGVIYNSEWITPTAMDGGEHFTPTTTSLYIVGSTGAVSMTLAACSSTGQLLFTYGDAANNVTIQDTNVRTNDGGAQVMGQYDLITWMCIGTTWVEISESNNS